MFKLALSSHYADLGCAGNWPDIRWQISYSNVIQRDNAEFVRRLDRSLVSLAKEKAKEVNNTWQLLSYIPY